MPNKMNTTCRLAESAGSQFVDLTRLSMPETAQAEALATVGRVAEIFWETSLGGEFSWCSSNLCRLLGFGPGEDSCKTPLDFVPVADRSRLANLLAAALAEEAPIAGFKHRLMLRSGGYCQVESDGSPVFDSIGNLKGYRFVTRDSGQETGSGQGSMVRNPSA